APEAPVGITGCCRERRRMSAFAVVARLMLGGLGAGAQLFAVPRGRTGRSARNAGFVPGKSVLELAAMGVIVAHRLRRAPGAVYADGALGVFDHLFSLPPICGGAGRGDGEIDLLQAIRVDIEIAYVVVRDRRHRVLDLGNRLLGDPAFEVGGGAMA